MTRENALLTVDEFNTIERERLPLAWSMGIRVEAIARGSARGRLPFREDLTRPGGTVAGPAIMALADLTMYAVVLGLVGVRELAVTTDFTVHFLSRPGPADLIADGLILKLGKRLAVIEVRIRTDGQPELIAHATGSYSLPPR